MTAAILHRHDFVVLPAVEHYFFTEQGPAQQVAIDQLVAPGSHIPSVFNKHRSSPVSVGRVVTPRSRGLLRSVRKVHDADGATTRELRDRLVTPDLAERTLCGPCGGDEIANLVTALPAVAIDFLVRVVEQRGAI